MSVVRISVTRPDGSPMQGVNVAIIDAATNIRQDEAISDNGGIATVNSTGSPFYVRPYITGDRHRVVITSFGNMPCYDYVISVEGHGTHTSVDAALDALELDAGIARSVFVCPGNAGPIETVGRSSALMPAMVWWQGAGAGLDDDGAVAYFQATGDWAADFSGTNIVSEWSFHDLGFIGTASSLGAIKNCNDGSKISYHDCLISDDDIAFAANGAAFLLDGCTIIGGGVISGSTRQARIHDCDLYECGNINIDQHQTFQFTDNLLNNQRLVLVSSNMAGLVVSDNDWDAGAVDVLDITLGSDAGNGINVTGNHFGQSTFRFSGRVDGMVFVGNTSIAVNGTTMIVHTGDEALFCIFEGNNFWTSRNAPNDIPSALTIVSGNFSYSVFGPNSPATQSKYNITGSNNEFYPGSSAIGTSTGGSASDAEPYLTVGSSSTLSAERAFTPRNNAFGIDLGPNGSYLLDTWRRGANIVAAATLVMGTDGDYYHVTGATGITALSLAQDGGRAYSAAVLALTPGGYWKLGEASGDFADSSGNANTATAFNTPTYAQIGALTFDANTATLFSRASSEYGSAADAASIDPGDTFTIMAWIKRVSNGTLQTIMSKGTGAFGLFLTTGNKLKLSKTGTSDIVESTTTITDTNYHFVVATKSGSTVKLYIDGVDVTGTVTDATCVTNASAFNFARNPDAGGEHFDGTLDEVAVFPTALTQAQVVGLYNNASKTGARIVLVFDSTPTLTHSSTLILQGAVNFTAAAGDVLEFMHEGSGIWREINRHTAAAAGGGGGTIVHTGTATIDFGAFPGASDTSLAITGQAAILSGSIVQAWLRPEASADHTADEHIFETIRIVAGNISAGTGFTIYAVNASELFEPPELVPSGETWAFGSATAMTATQRNNGRAGVQGGRATRLHGTWTVQWQWS